MVWEYQTVGLSLVSVINIGNTDVVLLWSPGEPVI